MTYLSCFLTRCLSIFTTIDEKKEEPKSEEKNLEIHKQLTLDNMNIQKIELLKIKLSHKLSSQQPKLPSEENLQKITFENSNYRFLEQICVSS